ncbi:MAG: PAS domain S-box protein, partial [Deinococcota bacterium]|nr:PAS domain S-box protein [Deinococcota bacterium]
MESCTEGNYVEEERRDAILSVVSFAAEHFLRNSDWAGQVPAVLARLGRAAAVSRVYIFQNHQNHHAGDTLASQRFEWVAPGTKAQLDNPDLQNLPFRAAGFARWHELLSQGELLAGNVKDFPGGERAFLEAQDVRSVMVVPVTVGGAWWGFIGFDDCNGERLWSKAEREALKAAASIFAAAIARRQSEEALQEGHRCYRRLFAEAARQAGELLLLERVRDAAQARDMKGVFRVVVEGIRETFGYHLVSLYLVQDGLLKCQHQSGYETVLTDIPLDTGIMARTVKSGAAVLVKDVAADPDFLAAIDGATSEICVPITLAGRVTGVLNVETAGGVKLGEADLRGLTSIGEQIGMVLERARESELSASIINSLPGTFYMFDKKGKMLRWNRRFEEVSGYSAEDMKRFHPLDFFPDYEKEGAAKAIERAFSAGEVSHEADILTKGGETLPFLLSGTRFDMGGETCVLGLGIDVSKRKRAEEALAASEANLRAIFEHSQDAFILIGRDLRIEAFNSVASERAKHAFNETIKQGDSMLNLVHPQDQDAFYNASGKVLSGNKVVIEREIKPVSGEAYWAEISYNPVLDDAGQITG